MLAGGYCPDWLAAICWVSTSRLLLTPSSLSDLGVLTRRGVTNTFACFPLPSRLFACFPLASRIFSDIPVSDSIFHYALHPLVPFPLRVFFCTIPTNCIIPTRRHLRTIPTPRTGNPHRPSQGRHYIFTRIPTDKYSLHLVCSLYRVVNGGVQLRLYGGVQLRLHGGVQS
ncbi:hypothetical protein C8R43DRAFT_1033502 [Mycena crocata]|nr:hypothetical protein C8R43DRAFT_1033502 [Mycena crocata]